MTASPRPSWGKTPSRYPQNNHPPRRYNISRGGNLSPPEQPGEVSKGGAAAAAPPLAAERGGPGGESRNSLPRCPFASFPTRERKAPGKDSQKIKIFSIKTEWSNIFHLNSPCKTIPPSISSLTALASTPRLCYTETTIFAKDGSPCCPSAFLAFCPFLWDLP